VYKLLAALGLVTAAATSLMIDAVRNKSRVLECTEMIYDAREVDRVSCIISYSSGLVVRLL